MITINEQPLSFWLQLFQENGLYRPFDIIRPDIRSWIGLKGGMFRSDLIPSHSYIVGAWVEARIFGLIFWLFVCYYATKAFFCLILLNPRLIPVLALILMGFLWSMWFSPFGAQVRIIAAFNLVVVQSILNRWMLAEKKSPLRVTVL